MPSTTGVVIELGGRVRVIREGAAGHARAPKGAVARRVLAVLALERRPVSRDELGDAVWGDALPRTWETALRGAVHQLRRDLAEVAPEADDLIRTAFGCYQLDAEVDVDVLLAAERLEAAERHLAGGDGESARAEAEAAVAVLGEPLAPGVEGEWFDEQRRRFEPLRGRAWLALSAACTACAEHVKAVEAAAAAVAVDPFDERAHRQLMTAHGAAGDRAAAMLAYRRCRELLADELGLTPSERTESVRRSLADAVQPVVPVALPRSLDTTLRLAGRDVELARLVAAWEDTDRGGPGAVVALTGPAGAGKSRLAAEVAVTAHGSGATVGHGRFDYDDLGVFGAIGEVLAQFGVAWPPPEAIGGARADRGELFDLARAALKEASSSGLLVVLDDVHWADRPSLALLAQLAADPVPGVVLVLTSRDDWVPPALAELLEVVERIEVAPLDEDGTADLVAAWAGHRPPPATVEQLQRHTGGNPYFLTAVLQDLADRGGFDLATGVGDLAADGCATQSVADLVTTAVARCGARAEEVALTAAALGHEFRIELLVETTGHGEGAVSAVLERLVHVRVVGRATQDGGRYRFVHALVRQSLIDAADPDAVRRCHRRAAEVLGRSAAASPDRLVHLLAARDHDRLDDAVEVGLAIADDLIDEGAPDEAATILTSLRDWLDEVGSSTHARAGVLMALATAEVARDHLVEGRAHLREAAELAVAAGDPSILRTGTLLLRPPTPLEHDPAAIDAAARLLDLAEPGSQLAVSARCWLAAEVGSTEVARAGALATAAYEDALRLGEPVVLRLAALTWHLMARGWTDPADRRRVMEDVLALRHPEGKQASDLSALVFLAGDCLELGDRAAADEAVERAVAGSATFGATHVRWIALRNQVLTTVLDGDLDLADALLAEATALAQALPIPEAVTMPVFQQVLTRYHQRRLDELHPLLVAFDDMAPPGPVTIVRAWAEAELGVPDGEASVDRAVELLLALERGAAWVGLAAITLEAAAATRHPRTAELASLLAPLSGRHAVIVTIAYLGAIDRYLGLAASAAGEPARAAELLRRAQAQHEAVGARCYLDRTAAELTLVEGTA